MLQFDSEYLWRFKSKLGFILLFIFIAFTILNLSETAMGYEDDSPIISDTLSKTPIYGTNKKEKSEMILINTMAKILDVDGHKETVTDVFDSFKTNAFFISAGQFGQSPIYRIPKKDVVSIELDGVYTNMSGWDYAQCIVKLTGDREQKGYIMVYHLGLDGYRVFQGKCSVGEYMISWKRLKKIEFLGRWIEVPAKDAKKKKMEDKSKKLEEGEW